MPVAAAALEAPPAPAPAPAESTAPAAEPEAEVLEVVDDGCLVVGRELRGEIHRRGLLHRAVYVWVFDAAGRLLLQQRSWEKKIGPGQWDLSAAEHLSIGGPPLGGRAVGLCRKRARPGAERAWQLLAFQAVKGGV
jgi:hypothetical protein